MIDKLVAAVGALRYPRSGLKVHGFFTNPGTSPLISKAQLIWLSKPLRNSAPYKNTPFHLPFWWFSVPGGAREPLIELGFCGLILEDPFAAGQENSLQWCNGHWRFGGVCSEEGGLFKV